MWQNTCVAFVIQHELRNMINYKYSHYNYFTIFASVLYQIYNHSPSARVYISDITPSIIFYIVHKMLKCYGGIFFPFLFLFQKKSLQYQKDSNNI